jgi:hypothetical protein
MMLLGGYSHMTYPKLADNKLKDQTQVLEPKNAAKSRLPKGFKLPPIGVDPLGFKSSIFPF